MIGLKDESSSLPDFTPHEFVGTGAGELGMTPCELCGEQERSIVHSLKFQSAAMGAAEVISWEQQK